MSRAPSSDEAVRLCVSQLAGTIEERVQALAIELSGRARTECEAAVQRARSAGEEELAKARAADAERAAEAEKARQQQMAALRAELQASYARDASRLEKEFDERLVGQLTEALSDAATAHAGELARVRASAAQSTAAAVQKARADLEREFAGERERLRAAAAAASAPAPPVQETKEPKRQTRAAAKAPEPDAAAAAQRQPVFLGIALVRSIRAIEQAATAAELLESLGRGLADEVGRVVMLVLHGSDAEVWSISGFGPELDCRRRGLKRDEIDKRGRGSIAEALERGELCYVRPAAAGGPQHSGLRFAELPEGRVGLAIPLHLHGKAAAVVYADDVAQDGRTIPSAWPEFVEVLVRHAARCLERLIPSGTSRAGIVPPLAGVEVSRQG
jgi:hypothetical protein